MKTYAHFVIICCWIILRMRNISDNGCRGNKNTHFMFCNFFQKFCCLYESVEKCGTARQIKDDNTIQCRIVICVLDNKGKNTHTHYV